MNSRLRFTIFAALVLTVTLTQLPSTVTSQQSKPPSVQKTPEQSQPSPEALEKLRRLAAKQKTYQVGYSPVMERKLTQLSGIEIPRGTVRQALKVRQEAQRKQAEWWEAMKRSYNGNVESLDIYKIIRDDLQKTNPGKQIPNDVKGFIPLLSAFSWLNYFYGGEGFMINQGDCNGCWAVAALNAYHYSYEIGKQRIHLRYPMSNGVMGVPPRIVRYFSHQALISCAGGGRGCGGGWHGTAFNYLVEYGATEEFTPCKERKVNEDFKALTWDYVNYPPDKIPTKIQLKTALLEHGPLVVLVRITEAFQAYQGGIFNERAPGEVNHAVVLIGWDDAKRAWLIQNSWGSNWGVKTDQGYGGYMWIAWDSNSVGKYAAWVDAAINYKEQ